jgi:hypothetical protein
MKTIILFFLFLIISSASKAQNNDTISDSILSETYTIAIPPFEPTGSGAIYLEPETIGADILRGTVGIQIFINGELEIKCYKIKNCFLYDLNDKLKYYYYDRLFLSCGEEEKTHPDYLKRFIKKIDEDVENLKIKRNYDIPSDSVYNMRTGVHLLNKMYYDNDGNRKKP